MKLMKPIFVFLLPLLFVGNVFAMPVTGSVLDESFMPLSSSSIYIKGGSKGTTANTEGYFTLDLPAGTYTLVCSHVGYAQEEQKITVANGMRPIVFYLSTQKTAYKSVIVKANAEDPAYAIIKHAIKEREKHLNELKAWQVQVYMKGMVRTVNIPKRVLGIKTHPDRNVVDSNGKGIIYFSESLTNYSRELPNKYQEDIVSAKVAGRSQAFGFNSPKAMELNLYENNINIGNLNNRGFVSPIGANALNFYRYKYEGSFYVNGLEISKIKVMPKRKYEPLFAGGYINIIEGSWRIQGVDLFLTKESEIQFVDSFHLQQQMLPLENDIWMPQQSTFDATFGTLGIKIAANFISVYSDYNTKPIFDRKKFGKVVRIADTSANKKTMNYWETIRPMPLTAEEHLDYLKKDTLEKMYLNPHYLDSLDKIRNKVTFNKILLTGIDVTRRSRKMRYHIEPLINALSYNTVEGAVFEIAPSISHYGDSGVYTIMPNLHYGFANKRFQASIFIDKRMGKDYNHRWDLRLGGGRNMFQINGANPIDKLDNSLATLRYKSNYMKLYEKGFITIGATKILADGLTGSIDLSWEKRHLPENADTNYTWKNKPDRYFTPNYPNTLPLGFFPDHQAFIATVKLRYQAGQQYIQYPNRTFSIGSSLPVFTFLYTHGFKNVLGSDVDFDKWKLSVTDELKLKLAGEIMYRFSVGGFLNSQKVFLSDWQHFNGNQTIQASAYGNSFQLLPYYAFSNKDPFYTSLNMEYHLNGLITNKIPLIRKLGLGLVTGTNTLYIDPNKYYSELFVGVENILKVFRVDVLWGYQANIGRPLVGLRIGIGGFLGD